MKVFLYLFAAAAVISCGLQEIGGDGSSAINGGSSWGGLTDVENGGAGILESVCYMTVLDYQKSYDWKTDADRETVKCSLVVYSDKVPMLKVPVGEEYEVGSDPDMHRMIGGHLYTDYSTCSETVVRRDGELMFRYEGREQICGMHVVGDDVYTLGQSRGGGGFSYRKNGAVLLERDNGTVIGKLNNDSDSLSFAFSEQIISHDGAVERYYSVIQGKVSQIAVREDMVKVWDVLTSEHGASYIASLTGVSCPVLVDGAKMRMLNMPVGAKMISCSLFRAGGKMGIEGMYSLKEGGVHSAVWIDGMLHAVFEKGMSISSLCAFDGGVCCALNPLRQGESGVIYRCGETYEMPKDYVCMGGGDMTMVNGILHVGLSSLKGRKPVVWKDGKVDSLSVNGYVSSIYAF